MQRAAMEMLSNGRARRIFEVDLPETKRNDDTTYVRACVYDLWGGDDQRSGLGLVVQLCC